MILYSLILSASAHQADPQSLLVSDQVPLFEAMQVDSGWYPSSGAMAVRVQVGANGTADVAMEGDAHLEWPTDLNLSITGEEDGGQITLSAILETSVSIRFDIAGYQWEQEIDSRSLEYTGQNQFTPFSIGSVQTVETTNEGGNAINFDTTVLAVVDVRFSGELRPNCVLEYTGNQWSIGETLLESDTDVAVFTATEGADSFTESAAFEGNFSTTCEMEFIPVFEVCVPIVGCQNWEAGQFGIEALSSDVDHIFPANDLLFSLPSMQADNVVDFGDVDIASISNQELMLENMGAMLLEGQAEIQDSDSGFSVFGANVYVPAGGQDSIVFAFSSETEGEHSTTLIISSNDPAQPAKEITLKANVVRGGKGCSSVSDQNIGIIGLLLPGIAFAYRRRRSKES
ncbi:MAG: hypothetical protein VX278_03525 [Myxococcota bacterium]|nr:hypothetical protein [Myxococcota bacterium]